MYTRASQVALVLKNLPANAGDVKRFLGQEDPLEEGMATHSSSCLENSLDRGTWWATVHRVAQSQTQLKQLITHAHNKSGYLQKYGLKTILKD